MDPFFKAVGGDIPTIGIIVAAFVGGHVLAAWFTKDSSLRRTASALFAIAILWLLLSLTRP